MWDPPPCWAPRQPNVPCAQALPTELSATVRGPPLAPPLPAFAPLPCPLPHTAGPQGGDTQQSNDNPPPGDHVTAPRAAAPWTPGPWTSTCLQLVTGPREPASRAVVGTGREAGAEARLAPVTGSRVVWTGWGAVWKHSDEHGASHRTRAAARLANAEALKRSRRSRGGGRGAPVRLRQRRAEGAGASLPGTSRL